MKKQLKIRVRTRGETVILKGNTNQQRIKNKRKQQ